MIPHRPAPNTQRQQRGIVSALGRTRTSDTRFRKPVLYPLSYEGTISQGDRVGPGPKSDLAH